MSVSNGENADETNFNSSFMSRNVDSDTDGKQVFKNVADSASTTDETASMSTRGGLSVAKKAFINEMNATTFKSLIKTFTNAATAAAGTITVDLTKSIQYRRVIGDGAPVTASLTPFGSMAGADDGIEIILCGQSDTFTVKLNSNDNQYGCLLNGSATLAKGNTLRLLYDSVMERFVEISRNF